MQSRKTLLISAAIVLALSVAGPLEPRADAGVRIAVGIRPPGPGLVWVDGCWSFGPHRHWVPGYWAPRPHVWRRESFERHEGWGRGREWNHRGWDRHDGLGSRDRDRHEERRDEHVRRWH